MIRERISFLLGPGGLKAASFFIVKAFVGIEVFRIICKTLDLTEMPVTPKTWRYVELRSAEDLATLHTSTAGQLGEQAGSLSGLFKRSGILHALVCDNKVVAQLNIETTPECEIDDPRLYLTPESVTPPPRCSSQVVDVAKHLLRVDADSASPCG